MASTGRLQADPLFQGLARPTMIAGVSFYYFVLNAMITMVAFINTGNFLAFLLGVVIHGFGYLLCMKEPRAVELWMLRMRTGFKSWNRVYHHNTNSYDVF
ncbi:MAG: type IV secretion system protein VirB3 [Rickettsiales bacterium]|nr:type IV secretion system protein VirB3 [Rickettsiales bacterium]|tara:strand:+ start:234 stop:533 length:300 start_codon:yes stop_codon:yes gene_type:complete